MTSIQTLSDVEGEPHANVFPDAEPRTVRLTLTAGEGVPSHSHPDREIVLYLLEGTVELQLGDEVHRIESDDVVRFDGDQEIAPRAVDDSVALLVLARRT